MSGMIGVPASSFTAEILAAQRMETMLIKSELFAICRPKQILRTSWESRVTSETSGVTYLGPNPWDGRFDQNEDDGFCQLTYVT